MKRGLFMAVLLAAIGSAGRGSPAFAEGPTGAAVAGTVEPAREPGLAEVAPDVVATVNGKPLSRDTLAALSIHYDGNLVLETLILRELERQEAARLGVTASKEEIEAYVRKTVQEGLDARARRNGAKDFADWTVKAGGTAEETARKVREAEDSLRPFAVPELLARKILLKSVQVTEADVAAEFDRRYGPKAKVLQIVLRSEANAQDVVRKLKLGADFAGMVEDVSVDNVSRRKGGEIEPLGRGSPLGDAAFKLKPGQFSDPVKTPDGFHILKLVELLPAADKHIEEVKDEIRESLTQSRMMDQREKWIDGLFDKAKIERKL